MPQRAIGNFVRARRRQLGLTQEELAERISRDGEWLTQSDISRIETGKVRFPRPERLERIAEALDVSLGDLLASVAAVGDDGQLLLSEPRSVLASDRWQAEVAPNDRYDPGIGHGEDQPGSSNVDLVRHAHNSAERLLEELIERQSTLLAALHDNERHRFVDVITELESVVQGWAALLRSMPADEVGRAARQGGNMIVPNGSGPASRRNGGFFRRLVDSIGHAAIVTDPAGSIKYWNRAAEELYGWKADEVLGRNIVDVTPSEISREEAVAIMERLRAGKSWSGRFRLRRRDGTPFWAYVSDTPVLDDDGNLTAIIGVSHEVESDRAQAAPEPSSRIESSL